MKMETTKRKKFTTLSVGVELKGMLEQAIIKKQRKLTYNDLLFELVEEFLNKKI
jgi:hypothetical protein